MVDTVIEQNLTFMCTECGNIDSGNVSVQLSSEELELLNINVKLEAECSKCNGLSMEVQKEISEALSALQSKRYKIIKADQGEYTGDLFSPYVLIDTSGARIGLPEGWVYAHGYDGTKPHVMIVPEGSFGELDKQQGIAQIKDYQTDKKFTFHQFDKKRKKYIAQLKSWAESLPYNNTVAVPQEAVDEIEKNIIDQD